MKKLISCAMLLCALASMYSFNTFTVKTHTISKPTDINFPLTGITGSSKGDVNYTITGSGMTPYDVIFTQGTTSYGTYHFVNEGNGQFTATGMNALLNIKGVQIKEDGSYWSLQFISIY